MYSCSSSGGTTGFNSAVAMYSVVILSGLFSSLDVLDGGTLRDSTCGLARLESDPALIQRRTPSMSLTKRGRRQSQVDFAKEPWFLPGMMYRRRPVPCHERADIHVVRSLPARQRNKRWYQALTQTEARTYPGNFSVLFIEYTKCFAKEVNNKGR